MNVILSYCSVFGNRILLNGSEVFAFPAEKGFEEFSTAAYRALGISYPKFFKMDHLCKLGFLAAEHLLIRAAELPVIIARQTGIVLSNRAASVETDRNYASSIADKSNYLPSPAVFVYTLPNILTGEICIRHKLQGENAFFITEQFDPVLIGTYTDNLINESDAPCVGGWVELDGADYHAFLYLAGPPPADSNKNLNFSNHTPENLKSLFLKK